MRLLEIHTDGACSGNPGEAGIGVVIAENGEVVRTISQAIGKATNNIAEYVALIYALQEALILRAEQISVHTDSELICHQITGRYKVKNENLKILHGMATHLLQGFRKVEITAIPRKENTQADHLATQAIKKAGQGDDPDG